jgi:hypothetical protein
VENRNRKGDSVKASKRIFFYGNSVILGSIRASLSRFSELEVVTLKLPQKKSQWLGSTRIDILIFDCQRTRPEEVITFLMGIPTHLLIGVNPDVNQVQFWSFRQLQELSTQGLLEMIKDEVNGFSVEHT